MADRGLVEVKTPEAVKDVTNTPDPNPICANRLPKIDNVMPDDKTNLMTSCIQFKLDYICTRKV